jgi:hypothetical protein
MGIGDWSYIHVETDSEQYSYLNNKFLIMSVNDTTVPESVSLGLFMMVSHKRIHTWIEPC